MTRTPLLGALAVVLHDDRVLLAQRRKRPDAGLWGFPGGHVEWGETAMAAAARELQEETGVIAEPQAYLTNIDLVRTGADGIAELHYLLAAVLCRYIGGTPVAADDVSDARWVAFADVTENRLRMSARVPDLLALARQART